MSIRALKKWLRFACLTVLAIGLVSGALIYHFAHDVEDASLGYTVVNGTLYPLSTQDSKIYRRNIEEFGGKAALVFDDFYRWFTELWEGKTLGKTVAWVSILIALGLYLLAGALVEPEPDAGDGSGSREHN